MDWAGLTLDKYHIIEPVDTSGMAQVYKAYQPDLGRYVAIKIIAADLDSNPTFREQFEQEAKTLAKLEHPNILPIYDYGYYENVPYLVTPYTPAGTLADRQGQQLPPEQAVHILCQVADALGYAHAMGVVHQYVKPANILFAESGRVLLADFGIVQTTQPQPDAGSSASGYMAPEQRAGKTVDGRADIYALGVLLYELLTGKRSSDQNLLTRSLSASRIPDPLTDVIACATDTQSDNRYELAEDFVAAAQEALLKIKGESVEPPTSTQQALEVVIIAILVLVGLGAGIYALKEAGSFFENFQAGKIQPLDSSYWMPAVTGSISCLVGAALLIFRDRTRTLSLKLVGVVALILVAGMTLIIPLSIIFEVLLEGIPSDATLGEMASVFGSVLVCSSPGILLLFIAGYYYTAERRKWRTLAQQNISPPPQAIQSSAARRARLKTRRLRNSLVKYVIIILLVGAAVRVVAYLAPPKSILARVASIFEYDLLLNSVLIGVALLAWYVFNQITSAAKKDDTDEMPSQVLSNIEERRARLDKTYEYQTRIKAFIAQTHEGPLRQRLQTATQQLDDWVASIERLTNRLNELEHNPVIRRDRNAVPRAIHMLEARLDRNPDLDPGVKEAARQTLAARQTQLRQLRALERVMTQGELQSEETVAALGTIYSQVLLVEAKDTHQGRRAQRLQADINEQAQTLRDLLHAMDEVQKVRPDALA